MRLLVLLCSFLIPISTFAASAPNVTNISATHRNGQTFITWDDPLTGASGSVLRYKVYRSTSQITDTSTATLIADGVLNNNGQLNTGAYNQTVRTSTSQAMAKVDGGGSALSLWTGLAVYTATASQSAYYAVVAYDPSAATYSTPSPIVAGENSTTSLVSESAGSITPVLQRENSYAGTGWDTQSGHPLMVKLHASNATGGFSYGGASTVGDLYAFWGDTSMSWQDGYQSVFDVYQDTTTTPDQIVLYPRDTSWNKAGTGSLETMWFGLSTTLLGGSAPNKAYNFTEEKLNTIIPWVSSEYQIDTNKVYATGGSMGAWGSVSYAFRHPEIFAAVFPDRPRWRQRTIADTTTAGNTTATSTVPMMESGAEAYYDRNDSVAFVEDANTAGSDLPPVAWGIGRNDGYATFAEQTDAVAALQAGKRWFAFAWDNGDHSTTTTSATIDQYRQASVFSKNVSYPVFSNSSIDDDPATDLTGCINCGWTWSILSDQSSSWSVSIANTHAGTVTVNVTPRNTQSFTISPGSAVSWSASTGQSGSSTADSMGLVTATGVNVLQGQSTTVTFNKIGSTTISVTSDISGSVPFTAGLAFKKGDVPTSPTLNISDYQVTVKKLWNDGSVKHAIASGYYSSTANTPTNITVSFSGTPPTGTSLTSADIQSAAPSASVQLGSIGTVNLSSLLSDPKRTWISGHEMVECHYQSMVGSSATLSVWFHVRLYKNGEVYVRAIIDNGMIDVATATETYIPTVIIGGSAVYTNGGSSLTQYAHTRWSVDGWIGTSDPDSVFAHDTTYLAQSKLVPNYWKKNPSETALNSLTTTYTPMAQGGWSTNQATGGYHNDIGIFPKWDALYVSSGADERAYRAVIANSSALNSYAIIRKDSSTGDTFKISNYPTTALPLYSATAGSLIWETAHHGEAGYLAYMLTGDYYHLEVLQDQASMLYLCQYLGNGNGTSRIMKGETRSSAWKMRTLAQASALLPASEVADDIRLLTKNNFDYWKNRVDSIEPKGIGYFYEFSGSTYGTGLVAVWQQHFYIQSVGFGSGIEPLVDMANYNIVRDYLYRGIVGILGDSNGYCFSKATTYRNKTNDGLGNDPDPNLFYKTWKEVQDATADAGQLLGVVGVCGNTLLGESSGKPGAAAAMGYWGIIMPAIAYAVQDGAPGAAESWARLTGADNFSAIETSGFDDTPTWGIYPLSISPPAVHTKTRYRLGSVPIIQRDD